MTDKNKVQQSVIVRILPPVYAPPSTLKESHPCFWVGVCATILTAGTIGIVYLAVIAR